MTAGFDFARAGVLVVRRFASYDDEPWRWYHYPVRAYQSRIDALKGGIVFLYEPRRGGTGPDAATGGRSAFIGCAVLGDSRPDPDDPTHAYVELRHALEFVEPVARTAAEIPQTVVRSAVAKISAAAAERIVKLGTAAVMQDPAKVADGLVDLSTPVEVVKRDMRTVIASRAVRDRTFRARVVRDAYGGRCALTGLLLKNGYGRAEADAAHIRPVEHGGPDIVQNGLALTKTVHWAFDRGLVSLADDGRILTVERGLDETLGRLLVPGRQALLPAAQENRPHHSFLTWHRAHVFKGAA